MTSLVLPHWRLQGPRLMSFACATGLRSCASEIAAPTYPFTRSPFWAPSGPVVVATFLVETWIMPANKSTHGRQI